MLDRAIKERRIMVNVASLVESGGAESAKPTAFTTEELGKIHAEVEAHVWGHAYGLILRGLRRSEVLALEWSDVDLTGRTLTGSKSRTIANAGSTYTGAPKTTNGYRTLPLDDGLLATLTEAKRRQPVLSGHLVVDEFGKPLHPEGLSDEWLVILESAKVPYQDLRAARRSSVTHMRDRGIADHIVAKWHGHDEAVMRKFYSVAFEDELKSAGDTLSAVLAKSS